VAAGRTQTERTRRYRAKVHEQARRVPVLEAKIVELEAQIAELQGREPSKTMGAAPMAIQAAKRSQPGKEQVGALAAQPARASRASNKLGDLFGVPARAIQDARIIRAHKPELEAEVKAGKMSLEEAAKLALQEAAPIVKQTAPAPAVKQAALEPVVSQAVKERKVATKQATKRRPRGSGGIEIWCFFSSRGSMGATVSEIIDAYDWSRIGPSVVPGHISGLRGRKVIKAPRGLTRPGADGKPEQVYVLVERAKRAAKERD
jgi:hypothetical protein